MARGRHRRHLPNDEVDWSGAGRAVARELFGPEGFLVVFLLILAAMFLLQAADSIPGGPALATVTTIGATVLAMSRAKAPRGWLRVGIGVGLLAVAAATVAEVQTGGGQVAPVVGATTFAVFLLLTLPAVLGAAFGHRRITLNTVAATLTAFLLIGMAFAALYRMAALLEDGPFFNQTDEATLSDTTYFSYVTLTTLGYGDLSPASSIGRGMATLEAVMGQVYLVTAVALTVSRLGDNRRDVEEVELDAELDAGAPPDDDRARDAQADSDDSDEASPPT